MALNVLVKRWAILIGIDFYMTGNGPKGSEAKGPRSIPQLRGSVRDITSMEKFLKETYRVEEDCIIKLTASEDPSLSTEKRPTYENIVGAFEQVTKDAKSGDLVYIQYCGHGALSKPDPSKKLPICELLVPTDICNGGQYLYDTEVSTLLGKMVDKGLVVDITLDSCHSGSGTRGDITVHRGIGEVDAPEPNTELAAELEKRYLSTDSDQSRGGQKRKSLLLEPEGYELFAACRQDEKAYEIDIGDCWRGTFSYSLLKTLRELGPQPTHGTLSQCTHDDTLSTSLKKGRTQTPVFAGNAGRYFFDVGGAQHISTIAVLGVSQDGVVTLNAGEAHGVCVGSEYAIYPKDTQVFQTISVSAYVRVQKTFGLKSEAQLPKGSFPQITPGYRAVLSKYGCPTLVQRPQYIGSDDLQREAVDRFNLGGDWHSFSTGIAPLKLIDPGNPDSRGQFCVVANQHGKYELWTETPSERVPNFIPCGNPEVFLRRLTRVARYKIINDINNSDANSSLRGEFEFEVKGSQPTGKTNEVVVNDGGKVEVEFRNNSEHTLNLTILDLNPSWGVSQLYPTKMPHGEDIRSGCSCLIEIDMSLPKGFPFKSGVDTFKAFVTRDGARFKSLEMEDLDMTTESDIYVDCAESNGPDPDRHGKVTPAPNRSTSSESWGTSQISLRVLKVAPAEEQLSALIATNTCSD